MRKLAAIAFVLMVVAGCDTEAHSTDAEAAAKLTKHQQDSILGASKVPGAQPVNRALTAADSQSAKASQFDALQDTIH